MFPPRLKTAIQLIADNVNFKIIEVLAEKGKITWQVLLNESGATHAKTLNIQVKQLVSAGLVDRYEIGRTLEGNAGELYFDLSPWGKALAKALQESVKSL